MCHCYAASGGDARVQDSAIILYKALEDAHGFKRLRRE